jgi:hypothetical protein
MMKRCEGFIFFMTLCIMTVITLLLMTCMHHVLLYHKALNEQELQHRNFYQLEHIAAQLVTKPDFLSRKICIEFGDSANEVLRHLIHNKGCVLSLGSTNYRYLIEDLGEFPCLVIKKGQQRRATRHLRISIIGGEGNDSALQLRFIKPAAVSECIGQERIVNSGISSWRYLSALTGKMVR